ncbi:MAG: cell division protein FtsZ, partial [Halothiobacillus sp. 15-55-196]
DLSIGEFMEIGELVQALAGDEALVKVGTAIDESLEGSLRVTLVATGLVRNTVIAEERKPRVVVHNESPRAAVSVSEQESQSAPMRHAVAQVRGNTAINMDVIDIPSFLRQQAD